MNDVNCRKPYRYKMNKSRTDLKQYREGIYFMKKDSGHTAASLAARQRPIVSSGRPVAELHIRRWGGGGGGGQLLTTYVRPLCKTCPADVGPLSHCWVADWAWQKRARGK